MLIRSIGELGGVGVDHSVANRLSLAVHHVEGPAWCPRHDAFEEKLELVRDVIEIARRKDASRGNARRAATEIAHLVGLPCLSNSCNWAAGTSAAQARANQ